MPISRTHSERRSTASARSTPRLMRSAVRSPNGPAFRKAANNLILTLVKAGNGEEAVARAKALVAEAPQDADRYFTLGPCRVRTGCRCGDRDVPPRAGTRTRDHTLARYNLALVLKRADRLPEAVETLKRAVEIEPRPEAFYTLGVIYWQQGDTDGAPCALLTGGGRWQTPRYADAYHTLGAVLAARKDWSGAADALRPRDCGSAGDCQARTTRSRACFSSRATRPAARPNSPKRNDSAACRARAGGRRLDRGREPDARERQPRRCARPVPSRHRRLRRICSGALPDGLGAAAARPAGGRAGGVCQSRSAQPRPRPTSAVPLRVPPFQRLPRFAPCVCARPVV